jgi:hypothetical protein
MYVFTRAQLRQFRAVVRRSKIGRSARFNPQLIIAALGDRYALQAVYETVTIQLSVTSTCARDRFVLPLEVLQACEGNSDDQVTIRQTANDRISVEWIDQRIPQVLEYDRLPADDIPPFPVLPNELSTNSHTFWSALKDAIGSAEKERTRYALDCLQLRGQAGQIVATDGQQALVQAGFTFPWTEDVLIPAVNVLGCQELTQGQQRISIGRTADWATLVLGAWTIAIKIEKDAHFPKVQSTIPTTAATRSRLNLTPEDAQFLLASLSKLPSEDQCNWPVTVELNGHVAVRGKSVGGAPATELVLSHSRLHGEPVRWQTNRKLLARAIGMGFRDVCLTDPESPALCDDGQRQFVWALLNSKDAIPARTDAVRIESPPVFETAPVSRPTTVRSHHRRMALPPPTREADSDQSLLKEPPGADTLALSTLIEDVEVLQVNLGGALAKSAALITGLKRQLGYTQLMRATVQSLQTLHAYPELTPTCTPLSQPH